MNQVLRKYWPYDEVTVSKDIGSESGFILATPWLKIRLNLPVEHVARAESFVNKLNQGLLTGHDLDDVNWFFSNLATYPLAYILPRVEIEGLDSHEIQNSNLNLTSPQELILSLTQKSSEFASISVFAQKRLTRPWTWDIDAALQFSHTNQKYDPQSLFSIARRFHLLNDIESNVTAKVLQTVQNLKSNPEKFRKASALVLRQNHYITEQCESVLSEALKISKNATEDVQNFIQAESGHDKILAKAVSSLGVSPEETPVLSSAIALMEVFRFVAQRNLLAFAMVVDIFERTSYQDVDPMAKVLNDGGESVAGRQIDIHRDINDSGGHENVALDFISNMQAVDESYAREALQLSELATLVIHQLSPETIDIIRGE